VTDNNNDNDNDNENKNKNENENYNDNNNDNSLNFYHAMKKLEEFFNPEATQYVRNFEQGRETQMNKL
jgi:hypothetical protein